MKAKIGVLVTVLLIATSQLILAGSATWSLNPTTSDWNTAGNWIPATVPNGPDDIATFGVSNQTTVNVSIFGTEVGEVVFNPGASAFTISSSVPTWYISGTGITNNSGITQIFEGGDLVLRNSAKAGDMTFFAVAGFMQIWDTASADHGTFVVDGGEVRFDGGGAVIFVGHSSAANATFTVNGGSVPQAGAGTVDFFDYATAGDGVFVLNGGTADFAGGGEVVLGLGALASKGTTGNATFIANSGTNGGYGGRIRFYNSDRSTARMKLFGNGNIDISYGFSNRTVGSIEGDGLVWLGGASLTTGANNLSTTFAGIIQDSGVWGGTGGSLIKSGDATLTLTGANTYTGRTTVTEGILRVKNTGGSATGTGPVQIAAGTFGGGGIIAGAVTVGTGHGTGAFLAPSGESHRPATLTVQNALSFKADATYIYNVNTRKTKADRVVASGVTIESGAQFSVGEVGNRNKKLATGQVFVAISNSAATPINGTFANLADGSTVTVGSNTLQADYQGGDGNDLTLTVVP